MHQILLVFGNTNGFVNPMLISFQQNVSCEDGSYHPLLKNKNISFSSRRLGL